MTGGTNIFYANGMQNKVGFAIFISEKIDLKMKITRDKEGHYIIMIKGSIQEEDITIVNIYAPNIGAPQYIRQILTDIKGENDSNTIIVGDCPGGSDGKASVYNVGDLGSIPGSGRFPGEGNGNPLQYSCLENPVNEGAWCRLLSLGSQRVGHD